MVFNRNAKVFSECFQIYWPIWASHQFLPRPDIITPILQMRKLWKGGERFTQDECGLLWPKGPQNFLDQGVSIGAGGRPAPTRGALGEGQQKWPTARPCRGPAPQTQQGQLSLSGPGLCSTPPTPVPQSIGRQLQ